MHTLRQSWSCWSRGNHWFPPSQAEHNKSCELNMITRHQKLLRAFIPCYLALFKPRTTLSSVFPCCGLYPLPCVSFLLTCTPSRLAQFPAMQQEHLSEKLHRAQHAPAESSLLLPCQSVISILSSSSLSLPRSPSFSVLLSRGINWTTLWHSSNRYGAIQPLVPNMQCVSECAVLTCALFH